MNWSPREAGSPHELGRRVNGQTAELGRRFDALGRFTRLAGVHVPESAALDRARQLVERAMTRLRLGESDEGDHTVVALAGATGVGKSSLFNALARMDISPAGHLRPTTGHAHACVWNPRGADALLDWLDVAPDRRFVRESVLDAEDEAPLRGLVLLDLPDVDSVATGNRIEADRLVGVVDLVIWVLDPQKYADQTVHEEYLRHMGALRDVTVVVFNQIDRLTPADADRCRADLARLVEADGLPGVPVIATSAATGAGIDEVRVLLEKTVSGRSAALARLEGELDDAVQRLSPLVDAEPPNEEGVSRTAVPELATGFAAALGVPAVAREADRTYRQRAAVPGWPFGGTGAALADVAPADPAAVGLAVRRLADHTSGGLPVPWPDEVRALASIDLPRLPDELGRALTAARGRAPGAVGWRVLRGLWWLGVVALLAGMGGLGWTLWTGAGDRVVADTVAAAGAGLAITTMVVAVIAARIGARRYRRTVEHQLREATLTVAREVVGPVRGVLRDYAEARAALTEAG